MSASAERPRAGMRPGNAGKPTCAALKSIKTGAVSSCHGIHALIGLRYAGFEHHPKVTEQDLRDAGFDAEIVDAVLALTKGPKETRIEAAKRAKINSLAREVKLADNADNMDLTRLVDPTEKDMLRMHEYVLVRKLLLS